MLATAATVMSIGRTNQVQRESTEYVRYPLQAHATGNVPRGALLQPDQPRSGPYQPGYAT